MGMWRWNVSSLITQQVSCIRGKTTKGITTLLYGNKNYNQGNGYLSLAG
mgnify:CR=1 FL=1